MTETKIRYQVIWHWTPDGKPDGFLKCQGRLDERTLRPHGSVSGFGYNSRTRYDHRTTRYRMMVSCEACRDSLPEMIAARRDARDRGTAVVEQLARFGVSASYENRHGPAVEMHLMEAEVMVKAMFALAADVQGALDQAFQRGMRAGRRTGVQGR